MMVSLSVRRATEGNRRLSKVLEGVPARRRDSDTKMHVTRHWPSLSATDFVVAAGASAPPSPSPVLSSLSTLQAMPPNPLTLKQRLVALSANINSPSGSRSHTFDSPPDSPVTSKRKMFFKPPFGRSSTSDVAHGEYHGQERIQEVMNRLIFQAGVDYEYVPTSLAYSPSQRDALRTRPMYVIP